MPPCASPEPCRAARAYRRVVPERFAQRVVLLRPIFPRARQLASRHRIMMLLRTARIASESILAALWLNSEPGFFLKFLAARDGRGPTPARQCSRRPLPPCISTRASSEERGATPGRDHHLESPTPHGVRGQPDSEAGRIPAPPGPARRAIHRPALLPARAGAPLAPKLAARIPSRRAAGAGLLPPLGPGRPARDPRARRRRQDPRVLQHVQPSRRAVRDRAFGQGAAIGLRLLSSSGSGRSRTSGRSSSSTARA